MQSTYRNVHACRVEQNQYSVLNELSVIAVGSRRQISYSESGGLFSILALRNNSEFLSCHVRLCPTYLLNTVIPAGLLGYRLAKLNLRAFDDSQS